MSILTTAGAPPVFLGYPLVNSWADNQAQIVATSMQALVHRIYQMDPTAYWQGSLGADDTKTEIITMGIYYRSAQAAVSVDTVMILNNNLNNFLIEYCTDYTPGSGGAAGTGTWQTLANVTGNAGTDYVNFLGAPIANVNGLRLTMTTTTPASSQKIVGNFIAALVLFQPSRPPSKLKPVLRQSRVDVLMGDKTVDYTYLLWSDNSWNLWDFEPLFDFVTSADKTNFDSLITRMTPFLYYPEPGDVARSVYLCAVKPKGYTPEYVAEADSSAWKGSGYKFSFPMDHVGWL